MTLENDAKAPSAPLTALSGDATPASWVWDLARLRITSGDAAAAALFGVADSEALKSLRFLPEESMARALSAAEPGQTTYFSIFCEDELVRVEARIESVNGDALAVRAQRRAEAVEPCARSLARREALLEAAPTPLALFEADGDPIWRNDAAARLFGEEMKPLDAHFANSKAGGAFRRAAMAYGAAQQTAALSIKGGDERGAVFARRVENERGDWEILMSVDTAIKRLGIAPNPLPSGAEPDYWRALAVFDADTLTLRAMNDAAAQIFVGAVIDQSGLLELFEQDEMALAEALEATMEAPGRAVELTLTKKTPPGPWLKAALWRGDSPAQASRAGGSEARAEATSPAVMLSFVDLTEERRALAQLKIHSDERMAAMNALGVGFAILNEVGAIRDISAAGAALLGVENAATLKGALFGSYLDEATDRKLARYLENGPVVEGRAFELGVDAGLRAGEALDGVRLALTPPSRLNQGRRAVAFTGRKAALADAEPTAASPAAESEKRSIDRSASHAIRTELTTIRGFTELIRRDDALASSALAQAYLEDIAESAEMIATLVTQEEASGGRERAEPATPEAAEPEDANWDEVDLGRFAKSVFDALAVASGPSDAPAVLVEADGSTPAQIRDRAALRELLEIASRFAPPPFQGRLTLHAVTDEDLSARLTLDGLVDAGDESASVFALRLMELLAERAGARFEREAASRAVLHFDGV